MLPDTVRVEIQGRSFTRWTSYEIAARIFNPPATFSLEVGRVDKATLGLLEEGAPVGIWVDVEGVEQQIMSGRIEDREHSYRNGQHNITISGYDGAHELQVSTAPFGLKVADRQFIDVVTDLVGPWGYSVVLSNEVSRYLAASHVNWKKLLGVMSKKEYYTQIKALQIANPTAAGFKAACLAAGIPTPPHVHDGIVKKMSEAKVDPGETVWDFLIRIANKAETFMWFSPDGMLTIARPQYEQDPLYLISHRPSTPKENNVIDASETRSIDGIPTAVSAHGRIKETKGAARKSYVVTQPSDILRSAVSKYGLYRPSAIKDKDARSRLDLKKRAYYAVKGAEKNHHTLSYTLARLSQGGHVWTFDTCAKVVDETLDIDDVYYVSGYRMKRSRSGDTAGPQQTTVELTERGVWTPA